MTWHTFTQTLWDKNDYVYGLLYGCPTVCRGASVHVGAHFCDGSCHFVSIFTEMTGDTLWIFQVIKRRENLFFI